MRNTITESLRGVYGVICKKQAEEFFVYVGRSENMKKRANFYERMVRKNDKVYLVPKLILEHEADGYDVEICVLKEMPFTGEGYERERQKLAFVEYTEIERLQELGQCLYQVPEGRSISKEEYNRIFKIE